MEKWRVIKDYPNYEVSNKGRVRRDGLVLIPNVCKRRGVNRVCLSQNGRRRTRNVSRLVADAFFGKGGFVFHRNSDKLNDSIDNLYLKPKRGPDKKVEYNEIHNLLQHGWNIKKIADWKKCNERTIRNLIKGRKEFIRCFNHLKTTSPRLPK